MPIMAAIRQEERSMAETSYSVPAVAMGDGTCFELQLRAMDGGQQTFQLRLADIPELVKSLAAISWASQAVNRPAAGTMLPKVNAFPVKTSEVGRIEGSHDPVLVVELFGGVKFALHFSAADGAETGRRLT